MIETRINNPKSPPDSAIRAIAASGQTPTIQFSAPVYSAELLRAVNRLCIEYGDRLEVRFFGHYGGRFDASVLLNIPDVSWLSIDCLSEIANEHEISKLSRLSRLSFGVFKFDNPQFLEQIEISNLTRLSLTENVTRNFDLAPLARAVKLTTLNIDGHTKNLIALSQLRQLSELTLRSTPKTQSLEFLRQVQNLTSLSLILGSRQTIDEITHPRLERLSLIRVRGLVGVGPLARFPHLRELQIEDQSRVSSIDLAGTDLRKVTLMKCKNLEELKGLASLSGLVEFRTAWTKLDLQALLEREWPPSLEVLALYSKSNKWNDATRAILDKQGYREFSFR